MDNGRNTVPSGAQRKVGYLRQKVGTIHEMLHEIGNRVTDLEDLARQLVSPRPTPQVTTRDRLSAGTRAEPFEGNSLEDRVDGIQVDADAIRDRLIILRDQLADAL